MAVSHRGGAGQAGGLQRVPRRRDPEETGRAAGGPRRGDVCFLMKCSSRVLNVIEVSNLGNIKSAAFVSLPSQKAFGDSTGHSEEVPYSRSPAFKPFMLLPPCRGQQHNNTREE